MSEHRLAFLASYNGSAAKAIAMACQSGALAMTPVLMISNNAQATALTWAADMGLDTAIINTKTTEDVDSAIAKALIDHTVTLVACSGYMKLIGPKTIESMSGRILNIHPALLPKHGGHGMYGHHVHKAVFDARDTQTGATIHVVDGEYDRGRILAQTIVPILPHDSADDIESKVKAAEPPFYIETLQSIVRGDITL